MQVTLQRQCTEVCGVHYAVLVMVYLMMFSHNNKKIHIYIALFQDDKACFHVIVNYLLSLSAYLKVEYAFQGQGTG